MKDTSLNHPLAPYIEQAGAVVGRAVYAVAQRIQKTWQQKPYRVDPDHVSEIFGDQTQLATSFIAWRLPAPSAPNLPPVIDQTQATFDPNGAYVGIDYALANNMFDVDSGHLEHA